MSEMNPEEFAGQPDKPKSFLDFLGTSRRRDNVEELVEQVMGIEGVDALVEALRADELRPDDIDELRSVLGGRQRRWESDEFYNLRSQAAEKLITARGKMAWQPGERPPDTPMFRSDSLSARFVRRPRPEKQRHPETESGDE